MKSLTLILGIGVLTVLGSVGAQAQEAGAFRAHIVGDVVVIVDTTTGKIVRLCDIDNNRGEPTAHCIDQ